MHASGGPYQFRRRFLYVTLLFIAVVTVLSSIPLSRFLSARLLMQDAEAMRAFVHGIVVVEQASDYFLGERDQDENIEELFKHIASMPDVARANVYGKDQRLLWSSNRQIIGQRAVLGLDLHLHLTQLPVEILEMLQYALYQLSKCARQLVVRLVQCYRHTFGKMSYPLWNNQSEFA